MTVPQLAGLSFQKHTSQDSQSIARAFKSLFMKAVFLRLFCSESILYMIPLFPSTGCKGCKTHDPG